MIEYKRGDILKEDVEALVNTVNCVGVMGRGIALQFKHAFSENFKAYALACKNEEVQPGRMFVFETGQLTNPRYIINFPTKRHWRSKSRMEDIEAGLSARLDMVHQYDIHSIAVPPLGSGLGGLDWSLEVHKLLYFMQEAGEPLRLKFQKGPYGPYAENLRHVLNAIEGHFITGYGDGGDAPDKRLELVPGVVEEAAAFLQRYPDTQDRYGKVSDLVDGFETPFGLELLSTVHWVRKNEPVRTIDEVIEHTYAWNERKRQFTPRQIKLTVDVLADKGWVSKPRTETA